MKLLCGRRVIYTDVEEITDGNVVSVLQKALAIHLQNRAEIDYLYRYYKGDQPILYRRKEVRPEINNTCLLYTSPSPRDTERSRMPSSA